MASTAASLRAQVLAAIKLRPLTADEVAAQLQRSVLSIRPRLSELVNSGQIMRSDERRTNVSGRTANVWRVCP